MWIHTLWIKGEMVSKTPQFSGMFQPERLQFFCKELGETQLSTAEPSNLEALLALATHTPKLKTKILQGVLGAIKRPGKRKSSLIQ